MKRVTATLLAILACATVALGGCVSTVQPSAAKRPANIIVILVDDMGFSDMGAFGSEIETPNLDRLAFGGLRLTDFQTTAKCFPSRASLLTGLYADQVNRGRRARAHMVGGVTLAESLSAAGYTTMMVGKHHGLTHPMDRGFDRYWGLRDGAANHFNPGTTARAGEAEPARKVADGRWWCFERTCQRGFLPSDPDFFSTDAFTDKALDYIATADDAAAPFFLYLSYTAPHDPLHAPDDYVEAVQGTYDEGYAPIAAARYARQIELGLIDEHHPRPQTTWRDWQSLSTEERADQAARMEIYAAMIANLDTNIGRLIETLEQRGILDDTLIVFSSDNGGSAELVLQDGEEIGSQHPIGSVGRWTSLGADWAEVSNTPFRFFKNDSFNGGTVVPTFVHWPAGGVPAGEIWDGPAHLIDLHPTFLALIDRDYDPMLGPDGRAPALPGEDLTQALLTGERAERQGLIFNHWQRSRMVRSGHWKLVSRVESGAAEDGDWQLFDMRVDRNETRNVAAEHPEIVERLGDAYDVWRGDVTAEPTTQ